MDNSLENLKIAVALRAARTAIGWNQQEMADLTGVAKSTIARIETLEMTAKADYLTRVLRLFRELDVTVDLLEADRVGFTIGPKGLAEAQSRLEDDAKRRSDRKKGG
jgi:transcriptional regulator with XRE-family HTH domain